MDFNFGQDPPSGSGSRPNWLGSGHRVEMSNSSPNAPNAMQEDDISFAESYRPEASPLFNPVYMPRDTTTEAAPSHGMSPGPAPTWPWQRDASTLDNTLNSDNFDSTDVSVLPEQPTRFSSSPEKPAAQEPERSTDAQNVISPERPASSSFERSTVRIQGDSIVQQYEEEEEILRVESDISPPVEESRVEIYEHNETTIIQSSEKQPDEIPTQQERNSGITPGEAERVEETPTETPAEPLSDADDNAQGQETPAKEASGSPVVNPTPAAGPGKLRSALLSVGRGIMKRMSAPPPVLAATSPQDDSQARARSTEPEQQPGTGASTPSLVVELKKMSEFEKEAFVEVSEDEEETAPVEEPAPKSAAKRGRPSRQSLLDKAAESTKKPVRARRSVASAPASPAVKKAPTSAVKRSRKSMPASVAVDETPKKRGRPRKSDAVATPAQPPSTAKRGRPRKSITTPIVVPSASKPLSARGRRVASASKAVATPRRPTSVRTPKTAIGLKAAATPTSTPRPRGRPPKNPKPAEEAEPEEAEPEAAAPEVEEPKRAGRASRTSNATEDVPSAKKATRSVKPRVVPSPAKRGRATRNAAAPSSPKTETPVATKRGRRAAAEPKEEAPVETPKRRGRPAAKVEAPAVEEPASEPKTRKRGRAAATEDTPAEEPAPKRRGRAAKPAPEEEPAPAPKRRGRAAASKASEEVAAEPATTKKRGVAKTASKMAENAASGPELAPKKRGRPAAAAKAAEDAPVETTAKRGRAKRSVPEPEPEVESPEPATKKRRTTRKAEEPAPVKVTKAASGKKPGRPAKTTKEAAEKTAPKRGKSTRTKAAEPAPVEEAPKPVKRGRGAAKKTEEPVAEAEPEKPNARGRPAKAKSGKGELPSSKNEDAPAAKRGRGAAATKAKAAAPTKVTKTTATKVTKVTAPAKTGRAAQTGVRRGLRSRG